MDIELHAPALGRPVEQRSSTAARADAGDEHAPATLGGELLRLPLRSLFPLVALLVIAGSALWGPWVSLVLAYGWWKIVARIG